VSIEWRGSFAKRGKMCFAVIYLFLFSGIPMNLVIDPRLKPRLEAQLAVLPSTAYLGIRLSKTGCSGWTFSLQPEERLAPNDTLFEVDGLRFGSHPRHASLIEGLHLTLQRNGLNETLVFESPLIAHRCGCGTSVQFDKSVEI
jgi:iron-sulfur cluster assembly protein